MKMIDTRDEPTEEIVRLNEREIERLNGMVGDRDRKIEDQKAVIGAMSGGRRERIIADNRRLEEIVEVKDEEIFKQQAEIKWLKASESSTVGNLRAINNNLCKAIDERDTAIRDAVRDIKELKVEQGFGAGIVIGNLRNINPTIEYGDKKDR